MPKSVGKLEELRPIDVKEEVLSVFQKNPGMAFTFEELANLALGYIGGVSPATSLTAGTYDEEIRSRLGRLSAILPVLEELIATGEIKRKVGLQIDKTMFSEKERVVIYYHKI